MPKNSPDERVVYLALKGVFKSTDAQLRKPKKIRELIKKHQQQGDIQDLIQEHNIDNVCNVAKVLLEERIFESTLNAKVRFPEVFEVSPAQSADRAVSENEAARNESDAIRDIVEGRQKDLLSIVSSDATMKERKSQLACRGQFTHSLRPTTSVVPSLYPVYLPFKSQHQLLVKVQSILEASCYTFVQNRIGCVLDEEGWDCPESVELNTWAKVLRKHQDKLSTDRMSYLGKPFPEVLDSVSHLRHTAVHRLRVSARKIETFMVDSESLARALEDDIRADVISQLRRETQSAIDELKRNKDLLESTLAETLQKFDAKRAELESLERAAVEDMLKEDKEYQSITSANLEQAVTSVTEKPMASVTSGRETDSEVDLDLEYVGEHRVHQMASDIQCEESS